MKRAVAGLIVVLVVAALTAPLVEAKLRKRALRAAPPLPSFPYWAFSTNSTFNTVEVHDLTFDGSGFPLIASIPVSYPPFGLAFNPQTHLAYVAEDTQVEVIDTQTLGVITTIDFSATALGITEIVITPDLSTLFLSGRDLLTGAAVILSITTTPTGGLPGPSVVLAGMMSPIGDIAFSPGPTQGGAAAIGASNRLFFTLPGIHQVGELDMGAGLDVSTATPTLGQIMQSPNYIDASSDGSRVYVTSSSDPYSNRAMALDARSQVTIYNPIVLDVTFGYANASDVLFRQSGTYAYVSHSYLSNLIDMIDTQTDQYVAGSSFNTGAAGSTLNRDSNDQVMMAMGDDYLQFFDVRTPGVPLFAWSFGGVGQYNRTIFAPRAVPIIDRMCPRGGDGLANGHIRLEGKGFSPTAVMRVFDPYSWQTSALYNLSVSPTSIEGDLPFDLSVDVVRSDIIVDNNLNGNIVQTKLYAAYTAASPTSFSIPIPTGSQASQYRLRSYPQITTSAQGLASLLVGMGPYDPYTWRMFMWDGKTQDYVEMADMSSSDCDWTGTGFWIMALDGGNATSNGTDTLANIAPAAPHLPVPLHPGWNIISDPFAGYQVDWLDVSNVQAGSASDFTNATDPASAGLSQLYDWDGTAYTTGTIMTPGKAYWVQNTTTDTVWAWLTPGASAVAVYTAPRVFQSLNPGDPVPPAPPGAIGSSSSNPRCAFTAKRGAEGDLTALLVGLALLALLRFRGTRTG